MPELTCDRLTCTIYWKRISNFAYHMFGARCNLTELYYIWSVGHDELTQITNKKEIDTMQDKFIDITDTDEDEPITICLPPAALHRLSKVTQYDYLRDGCVSFKYFVDISCEGHLYMAHILKNIDTIAGMHLYVSDEDNKLYNYDDSTDEDVLVYNGNPDDILWRPIIDVCYITAVGVCLTPAFIDICVTIVCV